MKSPLKPLPQPTPQPTPLGVLTVTWHERENLAEVTYQRMVLDGPQILDQWRRQLMSQLEAIHRQLGRRFNLLVCIDELTIRASVADGYGETAKTVLSRLCPRIARYGMSSTVRPLIAAEALKMDYKANLFDNRAAAVKFLQG